MTEINYALHKRATQSSLSPFSRAGEATGAVDGIFRNDYSFHTDREQSPWWQVDLAAEVLIQRIEIYNRPICAERASELSVLVSCDGRDWSSVHEQGGTFGGFRDGNPLVVPLLNRSAARFVRLQLRNEEYMHLNQVRVLVDVKEARRAARSIVSDPYAPAPYSMLLVGHRIAGLGDMFTQAAHCIVLGRMIGRQVAIDWRRSLFVPKDRLRDNIFGADIYHPEARPVEKVMMSSDEAEGYPAEDLRALRNGVYGHRCDAVVYSNLLSDPKSLRQYDGRGMIFTEPLAALLPDEQLYETLADFSFSDDIIATARQFADQNNLAGAVGVHYRHGNGEFSDVRSEAETLEEVDQIIAAADGMAGASRSARVFLCTDSLASEQHFGERLGDRLVVFPKMFAPSGAGAMHYGVSPEALDPHESLRGALIEWELLASCGSLVRDSWSSFTNYSTARLFVRDGSLENVKFLRMKRKAMRFLGSASRYISVMEDRLL